MNKSISILLKVGVFAVLTIIGIIYVINRSPVEDLGSYERQEMVRPDKSRSSFDNFFSSRSSKNRGYADEGDDDVSLTGSSGRYDEVRIGKNHHE